MMSRPPIHRISLQKLLLLSCMAPLSLASIPKPETPIMQQPQQSIRRPSHKQSKQNHNDLFYSTDDLHKMADSDRWMTFDDGVEFLPSHRLVHSDWDDAQIREWAARQLEDNAEQEEDKGSSTATGKTGLNNNIYRLSPFVDGDSEYDEYQQAWRLLGFMIDCDDDISNFNDDQYNNGDQGGSGDEGTGEGCDRYVIWAAYVDLEYEGNGIGEYQYYDRHNKVWNDVPCKMAENDRCAKMDCHLSDTHWSLLGMFKHHNMDDWMEQLFKHEGMCVWSDDEYDFMSDAREAWPEGCIPTGKTSVDGDSIYYSTKPISGGKLTIGLYTDTRCVEEYVSTGTEDTITVENLVGNVLAEGGSGDRNNNNQDDDGDGDYEDSFAGSLERWDDALETFRICQPCVAYDVNNWGYNLDDDANKGSSYGTYRYGVDDDYKYNYYYGNGYEQGEDFDCYDDADYTNVNQCMKFMAKTEMKTATIRDVTLANYQGTLVENPLKRYIGSKNRGWFQRRRNSTSAFGMYFFFICSLIIFGYGYISFTRVQKNSNYRLPRFQWNLKQPLVYS